MLYHGWYEFVMGELLGEESLIYQHQGTSTILLKVISLKAMCFTRAREDKSCER